jgi:molybdopterin-binding protein
MEISARNAVKGTVTALEVGSVNTEVVVEVAPGVSLTSIITKASAEKLGLTVGKPAYVIIKSSDVMIAID